MTLEERVARAIHKSDWSDWPDHSWDDLNDIEMEEYRLHARAAIKAVEEWHEGTAEHLEQFKLERVE